MSEMKRRSENEYSFLTEEFVSPPDCFYPAFTWTWNDTVTEEDIRSRLDAMKNAGIRTTYVLPETPRFAPNSMKTKLAPDYLTDEFMHLWEYAVKYAASVGIGMWLYDEDGWPSGYASGEVKKEKPYLGRKRMETDENGKIVRVQSDVFSTVDSLDDEIGETFVKKVHEKYEQAAPDLLGSVIPLSFTDEPGTGKAAYPRNVEEKFLKKYGYDMTEYLPALMDECNVKTDADKKARMDYYMLLGELFRANYFAPIRKWCEKTGMLSGGHLDLDNQTDGCTRHAYGSVLPLLREMHVPGVDVIWRQIFPPKEKGETPTREGNVFFPRFASSAAAQIGRRLALTESFAVFGAGLTQDEMRYVIGYQLVRGINLFNFMNASHSKDGAFPFVMRPMFVKEAPGYAHLNVISDYTARASYLMSLGSPAADTALYFPARDLHAGGADKENAIKAFDEAGKMLEEMQIDFDIIDDEGILKSVEEDGCLVLALAKYRHIVIPECRYMPENVRVIAEKYAGTGEKPIDFAGEGMLARKRILENGDEIVFLFNGNGERANVCVRIPEKKNAYRLNLINGAMSRFSGGCVQLEAGEEIAVLISENAREACAEGKPERVCGITEFDLSRVREACAEPVGLREYRYNEAYFHAETGGWDRYFGCLYVGEAKYRAKVCLPAPVKGDYVLSLGRVENSARIYVNGKHIADCALSPKCVTLPKEAIPEDGAFELVIEVANSMANQTTVIPVWEYYPKNETGNYNRFMLDFEKEGVGGGLYGPVEIFKAE